MVLISKTEEKKYSGQIFLFLIKKIAFSCVPTTGKAFSPQKRKFSTSKIVCRLFLPSWIWIRIVNPDTDLETPLNPGPIQIRIRIHNTASNGNQFRDEWSSFFGKLHFLHCSHLRSVVDLNPDWSGIPGQVRSGYLSEMGSDLFTRVPVCPHRTVLCHTQFWQSYLIPFFMIFFALILSLALNSFLNSESVR